MTKNGKILVDLKEEVVGSILKEIEIGVLTEVSQEQSRFWVDEWNRVEIPGFFTILVSSFGRVFSVYCLQFVSAGNCIRIAWTNVKF